MRKSFISKVTRVHKATTDANDTSLCSTILVLSLEFHPGRPTTKFVPVTEPARLPGPYEEAVIKRSPLLSGRGHHLEFPIGLHDDTRTMSSFFQQLIKHNMVYIKTYCLG